MAHEVFHEIAEYSCCEGKIAGVPRGFDWSSLLQALMAALMQACPAKFANQAAYEETYDAEMSRLMKGRDHCPLILRPVMKRNGITRKGPQDQAWFRSFTASNGYSLALLKAGAMESATEEV